MKRDAIIHIVHDVCPPHTRPGEVASHAKLTPEQVQTIRQLYVVGAAGTWRLAREFGIDRAAISRIIRGKNWKVASGPIAEPDRVRPPYRGEVAHNARLTKSIVCEMRRLYTSSTLSVGALARRFGISDTAAFRAITGETWGHVTDVPPVTAMRSCGLPGERHNLARLTEGDVRAIRARRAAGGVSLAAIAREYGITKTAVLWVVQRKTWKHVQ
ncbi:hypothetical protein [Myxococcus landrumensis]|uniref:hypothetical protein n=1 Tax=Myxococcus landrumensis TaxID=2813577 RepID=UPI001F50C144|nr:hypothetical protein [Myxococcus landrumus]